MINGSITSRLHYCNSLFYGAKGYDTSQLQICQNNATQMSSLRHKFDHITPVLKDLYWLPVEQRIEYKVLLLTYKSLHCKALTYISQLMSLHTPNRALRSETKNLIRVPTQRARFMGPTWGPSGNCRPQSKYSTVNTQRLLAVNAFYTQILCGSDRVIWQWQMLNSLWPSDTIRRHISESALSQVMICCLTAPSHYLNQCWLIIREILWLFGASNAEYSSGWYEWTPDFSWHQGRQIAKDHIPNFKLITVKRVI